MNYFLAIFFLLLQAGIASAATEQMVRYHDSGGQAHYVKEIGEVPPEYRPSAAIVRVRKTEPEPEAAPQQPKPSETAREKEKAAPRTTETAKHYSVEDVKNAVYFTESLKFEILPDGKAGFKGKLRNNLDTGVEGVKITLDLADMNSKQIGKKTFSIKGGTGALEAGEALDIELVMDVPGRKVAGFTYKVEWEAPIAKSVSVKETPSEGETSTQR